MKRVVLFGVADRDRLETALLIRRQVFVDEQGVPPEEELDEHDGDDDRAVHALAYDGDAALGTGRFYEPEADWAQIGRMAVLARYRRRGVGAALLAALVAEALGRGLAGARLLAQTDAVPFYERAGFRVTGDLVLDGGILHRPMERVWRKVARGGRKEPPPS